MGYRQKYNSKTPFNFGEGTGRSPLSKNIEPPKKGPGAGPNKPPSKTLPFPGPRTAAVPPDLDLKPERKGLSTTEPPTEKPSPAAKKTSPLNQVRGQQRMNPSTLKPHVEHGTGRGSRTGKGIKHSHTI